MNREWQRLAALVNTAQLKQAPIPGPGERVEVVIIGAGPAGLAAAYALRQHRPLVLELEAQPGGRILTRSQAGLAYDLGAVFGVDPAWLPFPARPPGWLPAPRRVGIAWQGAVQFGPNPAACLRALDWTPSERAALDVFIDSDARQPAALPGGPYRALNAFFQVIHPGEMSEAIPQRQRDALLTFGVDRCSQGNAWLVNALVEQAGLGGRLLLETAALAVAQEPGEVRVTYRRASTTETVRARAVVIATPAGTVRQLLGQQVPLDSPYLQALQYGPGAVVVLGVRAAEWMDFAYLVTPDGPASTFLVQPTPNPAVRLLSIYFAAGKAFPLAGVQPAAAVGQALEAARALGLGDLADEQVVFSDFHYWREIGPLCTPAAQAAWQPGAARPSERVFLAGEYLAVDPHNFMPYGVGAALGAGRQVGENVAHFLETARPTGPQPSAASLYAGHYLVQADIYRVDGDHPQFLGRLAEGDIAFYGLVLQANRDPALRDYLLGQAVNGLWEYQAGFGVTCEDSALVFEGLLQAGVPAGQLQPNLEVFVRRFYDPPAGAFVTLRGGRAPYWLGPSPDASAQGAFLIQRIAPQKYAGQLEACHAYLRQAQNPDGSWQGKWFPSFLVTTYYAVRTLVEAGTSPQAVERAVNFVLRTQSAAGDWGGSVIDTAAAVLALKAGAPASQRGGAEQRGRSWLASRRVGDGWPGEPLLYYWFELPGGEKRFYHCTDTGPVTTAWARLALAE